MTRTAFCVSPKRLLMTMLLMMAGLVHQLTFVQSSPFSVRGTDMLRAGNGVFGDIGLMRPARSTGGGFGQQSDSFFNGRSRGNDRTFSRPASLGFRNSPRNSRYGEDLSAFRNLFGQDIGQSAGIYDSFGKPKQNNLDLIAQTRPAGRLRLDESARNSPSNDMERYRKHPFSSIRLSPVNKLSGVQVHTPFGNHQRDGHRGNDSKDFFAENRARNFRQKDPFERPISRSNFPLPRVNEDISLELPKGSNSPARPRKVYQPNKNFGEKESDVFGKPLQPNRSSFKDTEIPIASAPADSFVWSKPIGVPFVGANNSSNGTSPDKKASLINVKPGDSLSFPKTKALKLPALPSVNQKTKNAVQKGNNTSDVKSSKGSIAPGNNGVVNLADLINTEKESTIRGLDNPPLIDGFDVINDIDNTKSASLDKIQKNPEDKVASDMNDLRGNNGGIDSVISPKAGFVDEPQTSSVNRKFIPDTDGREVLPTKDGTLVENKMRPVTNEIKQPNVKLESFQTVGTPTSNILDTKPKSKSNYDVTILTNEAITKKSSDHPGKNNIDDSRTLLENGKSYEISPLDVPAIKTVVERTIEDGSETIVKNERHLEADDSGFILTNDLYSDETDLEGIQETDTIPYTGSPIERLKNEINGQSSQQLPNIKNTLDTSPLTLEDSQASTNIGVETYQENDQVSTKGNSNPGPESGQIFLSPNTYSFGPSREGKESLEMGHTEADDNVGFTVTQARPAVGSGYLMSDSYFDGKEFPPPLPPPPPLAVPSTTTTLVEEEGKTFEDELEHPRGTRKVPLSDTSTVLTANEEKLMKILQIDTKPSRDPQSTGSKIDHNEDLGSFRRIDVEADGARSRDQIISTPNTIIEEEEHIGLEQLKRMEEEAKQKATSAAHTQRPSNSDRLNGVNDDNFAAPNETPNPFRPTSDSSVWLSENGKHNENIVKQLDNYESETKRKSKSPSFQEDDFTINTDPASLNFDDIGAGTGNVDYHRKFDSDDSAVGEPSNQSPTQASLRKSPSESSYKSPGNDYNMVDGGKFDIDGSNTNQNSLPDDFINTGFNVIQKPMDKLKNSEVKTRNKLVKKGGDIVEGPEDRHAQQEKSKDTPFFDDDIVDYSTYEDPLYGYEYDYDPSPPAETGKPRQTSAFLDSPFQSMFGKTSDESRRGSFGTLFQNLGQPSRSRGGANTDGGWGLFDDKLGQIIKTRPSLNLFNG